jgi:hypothetical protein
MTGRRSKTACASPAARSDRDRSRRPTRSTR